MTVENFITEASLGQQIEALEHGALTAVEIIQAYLSRIHEYDQQGPCLNSIIHLNPHALEEAERADQKRKQTDICGPLNGVTVLVKDNYLTRAMPTSAGNVHLASFQASAEAVQINALQRAGAIILGKTTLHEFSSGITTTASISGQTRNALNWHNAPGGSSGGSAVAIAASFSAIALGTDTSGSIRIPAAFHGLYGLRPTIGRFSTEGVIPLCPSFDTVGPLARTPRDLARVLDVMALNKGCAPAHYLQNLQIASFQSLRIGVLHELNENADPQVSYVINQALHTLQSLHTTLIPVSFPEFLQLLPRVNLSDLECAHALESFLKLYGAPIQSLPLLLEQGGYHHQQHTLFQRRAFPSSVKETNTSMVATATLLRSQLIAMMQSLRLDLLLYPSCSMLPAPLGRTQTGANGLLSAVSGCPAITLPAGIGQDGSAIGLELMALPHQEQTLLNIAHAWHHVTQPAFHGSTFLPPLPSNAPSHTYQIHAGICTFQIRCKLERTRARLTFYCDIIKQSAQALALNLEIYENAQWLALDNLYTSYRALHQPYHYNLTLYTWKALNEGRLRLRAFSLQVKLGGEGIVLLPFS